MQKSFVVAALFASAALFLGACSSKKPSPPMTPTPTPDAGAVADADTDDAGAQEAGVSDVADAGPVFFTGGGDGGGAAPPAPGEGAVDAAIDLAITTAAPKLAPKMDKDGAPSHATLAEGQHFSMMINLAPNRCYTIIANSPPGAVSKLDLKLYGPPLFNIEAGKSGPNDKNMPVIGKGSAAMCPIVPITVPYKVDVAATKGTGRIGVQVYARNK